MKRVALLLCLSPFAFAQDIDLPHTLSNSSVADADQVMANFNALKDGVNSRVSVDLTNYNVVIGDGLQSVTPGTAPDGSGKFNTASGLAALYANTTGIGNTASGRKSLQYNTTGIFNTASGAWALNFNTTGNQNTASGVYALVENTTGNSNTAVGYFADVTSGNLQNATAIGAEAKVNASNKMQLGNANVTSVATFGKLTTGDVTYLTIPPM